MSLGDIIWIPLDDEVFLKYELDHAVNELPVNTDFYVNNQREDFLYFRCLPAYT